MALSRTFPYSCHGNHHTPQQDESKTLVLKHGASGNSDFFFMQIRVQQYNASIKFTPELGDGNNPETVLPKQWIASCTSFKLSLSILLLLLSYHDIKKNSLRKEQIRQATLSAFVLVNLCILSPKRQLLGLWTMYLHRYFEKKKRTSLNSEFKKKKRYKSCFEISSQIYPDFFLLIYQKLFFKN